MIERRRSIVPASLLSAGLLFIYSAERIASPDGAARAVLLGIGALGIVCALLIRILLLRRASGERRSVERLLLAFTCGVIASLCLHALGTDKGLALLGVAAQEGSRVPGIITVSFALLLGVSLFPLLFMELSYASMPSEESVERRRIDVSAQAGLTIALALAALFSMEYALGGWAKKWDLSYFKTTRPSAATKRLVGRLGQPMRVYAYFPKINEVAEQVMPYLRDIDVASGDVRVERVDHALRPKLAREHRVSKNGTLVLEQAGKHENISVGLELEEARSKLRRLDGDFQKAFLKLTRPGRTLYVTTGHEERGDPEVHDSDELATEDFRSLLSEMGIQTRSLGIGQGLASEVPGDATAVVILGPRKPFLPEEARALARYVEAGGHLLAMIDSGDDTGLSPLLTALGLKVLPGTVASESNYMVRDRDASSRSDRVNVYSNRYSAHPTVTSASRLSQRVVSIFVAGGALDRVQAQEGSAPPASGPNIIFTVRSMQGTWLDLDGDFELDDGVEAKASYNLVAAVSLRGAGRQGAESEGRAVVIGDADFATDQILPNIGNAIVVADSLRWLVGEPELPGLAESEEDVRIEHTREDDVTWFYGTIFAVPALVLAAGLGIVRLSRRRKAAP